MALGAYVAATQAVSPESILKAIEKVVPEGRAALRGINAEAFKRGLAEAAFSAAAQ